LTGGSPANCTSGSNNWYGKLWYHWNNANTVAGNTKMMKDYLDPINSGAETLNGIYNSIIGNTDLKSLTVTPGDLVPSFSSSQTVYTVNVPESVGVITVSATPANADATVTGTGNHSLNIGNNTIRIVVTAPGNSTSKTYTLTVIRALSIPPDKYEPNNALDQAFSLPISFSNNLAVVETTGSNFHNTTDIDYYKITLPSGYNYTISAELFDLHNNDETNSYTVDAIFSVSRNGTIWSDEYDDIMPVNMVVINGGVVYFRVTPYFSGEIGKYLLYLTAERKQAGGNNDANLNALAVSRGVLYPDFNSNRTNYSITVGNSIDGIMVSATPSDANATVSGNGFHSIKVGSNPPIPIMVTAQNGTTTKTYNLTVTRLPRAGSNANLKDLSIDPGVLSPRFSVFSSSTSYNATVENTVNQVNVSAVLDDEYASVKGAGEHKLEVGNNEINIDVIAENGATIKTYRINVLREIISGMEDTFHKSLIAYPNPAREQIIVSGLTGSGILTITDAIGRERIRHNITSSKEIISVTSLPSGIYFMRVIEEDKSKTIKIIVK